MDETSRRFIHEKFRRPKGPARLLPIWAEILERIRTPILQCGESLTRMLPGHEGEISVGGIEGRTLKVAIAFGDLDPEVGTLLKVRLMCAVIESKPDGAVTGEELERRVREESVSIFPRAVQTGPTVQCMAEVVFEGSLLDIHSWDPEMPVRVIDLRAPDEEWQSELMTYMDRFVSFLGQVPEFMAERMRLKDHFPPPPESQ